LDDRASDTSCSYFEDHTFGIARSIICQQKGMKNWAMYAKWNNAKQFQQMKAKGSICEDGFEDFFL
jgi:hypothetical protein